jgi:hypothetical protein
MLGNELKKLCPETFSHQKSTLLISQYIKICLCLRPHPTLNV